MNEFLGMPRASVKTDTPDRRLSVHTHAELVALLQHYVNRLRVVGMHDDGKTKTTGQLTFADVNPVIATIIAACGMRRFNLSMIGLSLRSLACRPI